MMTLPKFAVFLLKIVAYPYNSRKLFSTVCILCQSIFDYLTSLPILQIKFDLNMVFVIRLFIGQRQNSTKTQNLTKFRSSTIKRTVQYSFIMRNMTQFLSFYIQRRIIFENSIFQTFEYLQTWFFYLSVFVSAIWRFLVFADSTRPHRYRDVIFLNSLIPLEQCFSTWS